MNQPLHLIEEYKTCVTLCGQYSVSSLKFTKQMWFPDEYEQCVCGNIFWIQVEMNKENWTSERLHQRACDIIEDWLQATQYWFQSR